MDLNKFRNKDFYNILVSFDDEAGESNKYEMDKNNRPIIPIFLK